MWEEVVTSWPIIPFSAIGLCIVLLYDAGARDTGRVTQLGVLLIGVSIIGCLSIGLWNMTVSIARLSAHQNAYAASAPAPGRE